MGSGEPLRLTREQVREIDRRAIEEYAMPGTILMENAARAVADVAKEMLADIKWPTVAIVCGDGNNGGDGLAVARHLHNSGFTVELIIGTDHSKYRGDAEVNWRIVEAMGLVSDTCWNPDNAMLHANLVIDALFGTGLTSPPRDTRLIDLMNGLRKKVLSVDLPSGMDCDTGLPLGTCVRAARTVTFVAEKVGFANPASKEFTGEITIGDIGCPRELIEEVANMKPQ